MTAPDINKKFVTWAVGLLTTGLVSSLSWAWNLDSKIAVLEANQLNDRNSIETADEVLKNWSSINSTQESHARQLKGLWEHLNKAQEKEAAALQRLSRIEIKQEICCD